MSKIEQRRASLGRITTSVRSEARDARVLKQSRRATSINLLVTAWRAYSSTCAWLRRRSVNALDEKIFAVEQKFMRRSDASHQQTTSWWKKFMHERCFYATPKTSKNRQKWGFWGVWKKGQKWPFLDPRIYGRMWPIWPGPYQVSGPGKSPKNRFFDVFW